jgi:hypothetical protein
LIFKGFLFPLCNLPRNFNKRKKEQFATFLKTL